MSSEIHVGQRVRKSALRAYIGRAPVALGLITALWLPSSILAESMLSAKDRDLAHDIFRELIAYRTVAGSKETVPAARALAARLKEAGFPAKDIQVLGPEPDLGNLVVRYRGSGQGGHPILLMAHIDVVEALPEDWSLDPFELVERDGWFYGRGTMDNKAGAVILVANFIRLKREGFTPDRDLIMVLTADEETSGQSIHWLVNERRDLVDAEYALNSDAGSVVVRDGREVMFQVQASEKMYLSFQLDVKNKGGHSSKPTPDNAIYHLAEGLARLARFQFPVSLNEVTRAFFERSASLESGQKAEDMRAIASDPRDSAAAERLAESPYYNALMRTTCVATQLEGGHAENALPQTARATVNCRILPDDSPDDIERTLSEVLADEQITVTRIGAPIPSPASPLQKEIMQPLERLTAEMLPGLPVIPSMSTGATDGLFVRNAGIPTYGIPSIFVDQDDDRAHGRDERLAISHFDQLLEYWHKLLKQLSKNTS